MPILTDCYGPDRAAARRVLVNEKIRYRNLMENYTRTGRLLDLK